MALLNILQSLPYDDDGVITIFCLMQNYVLSIVFMISVKYER